MENIDYFISSGQKEIRLLRKHFKVVGKGEQVKINQISPSIIKDFFREYLATVRPKKLQRNKILPKAEQTILRGLYYGDTDGNILINAIIRHSLYVDQILVTDPLLGALTIEEKSNVLNSPEKWIYEIADNVLSICSVEDWINEGIIILIPAFNYYYPEIVYEYALKYQKIISFDDKPPNYMKEKFFINSLVNEPPEDRENLIEYFINSGLLNEVEVAQLLSKLSDYEKNNPLRFQMNFSEIKKLFPPKTENFGQIIRFEAGLPITLLSDIARETGSFVLFEDMNTYEHIKLNLDKISKRSSNFEQLSLGFQSLDFNFLNNVSLQEALRIRKKEYLSSFRQYLRELWSVTTTIEDDEQLNNQILEFSDRFKQEYNKLSSDWMNIRHELRLNAAIKGAGIGLATVGVGNVNLSLGIIAGISGGLITGIDGYYKFSNDIKEARSHPLSMFLNIKKS